VCAGAAAGVAARAAGGGRSRARSGVSGGPLHVCSSSRAAAGAAAEAAAGSRRRFWRPGRRLRGVRSWGAAGAARGRRGAASRRFSAVAPRCMPVGFARWKKVVNRTFFGPQPTPRGKPSHSRPEAHFRLSEHKPTSTHNGHVSVWQCVGHGWVVTSMDLHGPEISRICSSSPRFRAFGAKACGFGQNPRAFASSAVLASLYLPYLGRVAPRR
jgi:hypothetical protein